MAECFVGDVGVEIFIDTDLDLTDASALSIRYRKPDGTDGEWPATVYQKDGEFGIRRITQTGDLDQAGVWELQVEITGFQGYTGVSTKTTLDVGRPLAGA